MGNCCAHEARQEDNTNFNKQPVVQVSDFPSEDQAQKVEKMNPAAAQADSLFKALGDWKLRSQPSSSGYQIGGPYRYIKSNATYEGQFLNRKRDGLGTLISADGEFYTGNFQNDTQQGSGRFIGKDGVLYEGEWHNGKKSGQGKETSGRGEYNG